MILASLIHAAFACNQVPVVNACAEGKVAHVEGQACSPVGGALMFAEVETLRQ